MGRTGPWDLESGLESKFREAPVRHIYLIEEAKRRPREKDEHFASNSGGPE